MALFNFFKNQGKFEKNNSKEIRGTFQKKKGKKYNLHQVFFYNNYPYFGPLG